MVSVVGLDPSLRSFGVAKVSAFMENPSLDLAGAFSTGPERTLWDRVEMACDYTASHVRGVRDVGIETPGHGSFRSDTLNALFVAIMRLMKEKKKRVVLFNPQHVILFKGTKENAKGVSQFKKIVGVTGRMRSDIADAGYVALMTHSFWRNVETFKKGGDPVFSGFCEPAAEKRIFWSEELSKSKNLARRGIKKKIGMLYNLEEVCFDYTGE